MKLALARAMLLNADILLLDGGEREGGVCGWDVVAAAGVAENVLTMLCCYKGGRRGERKRGVWRPS